MEQWTGEERAFAIKSYYKNNDSVVVAQRLFRRQFNIQRNRPVPSANAIKTWVKKFENTGSALKQKPPGKGKSVRTPENIANVKMAIEQNPQRSARRLAATLNISDRTLRRIMHVDLNFHPYKTETEKASADPDYVNHDSSISPNGDAT